MNRITRGHKTARIFVPSLAAALLGALFAFSPLSASAQSSVPPAPTPFPVPSLPPADAPSDLPYPAYGTPQPGVTTTQAVPGIKPVITLKQAVDIAVARSPQLATARADAALARTEVKLAPFALLPNISASATTTRVNGQKGGTTTTTTGGNGTTSTGGFGSNYTSNGLSVDVQQLIFDGGKTLAEIRAARRGDVAAADTYKFQVETLANTVAQAYYTALAARRTTQVDTESVRNAVVQEDLVKAQAKAGTAARIDAVTAGLQTAQARIALVRQQGTEIGAVAAFENAIGLDANAAVLPADDSPDFSNPGAISTIPVPTYDQAVKRAYALRPDLDSAQATVDQANYSLKAADLGYFPTLTGTASGGTSSTDAVGGTYRNSNSVGLVLAIPIFDQGQRALVVAQARATYEIDKGVYDTTRLGVQLSVRQALAGFVSAKAGIDLVNVEYSEATQVLQATQAQYKAGVTTLPLLLNAQTQYTQALVDRVNAVYTLRQAEQTLLYATGANI
jgi:outer membrane protein TolC